MNITEILQNREKVIHFKRNFKHEGDYSEFDMFSKKC